MNGTTRLIAAAMLVGLGILGSAPGVAAQPPAGDAAATAAHAPGSLEGLVRDEKGAPLAGAVVSAVGSTTAFVLTDEAGHFEFGTLSPGQYLLRAHSSGFAAVRGQSVEVRAGGRGSCAIALSRVSTVRPVLEAGMSVPMAASTAVGGPADGVEPDPAAAAEGTPPADDHQDTAWRLRHARRGVLKDARMPQGVLAEGDLQSSDGDAVSRLLGAAPRLATNFFADTPFSGQFNLLTSGTFDTAQQLFTPDSFSRSVADVSVGAPAGSRADWMARAALTQGDASSWIVAGSYTTRAPARRLYDVGLSYSTQRYTAGNPAVFQGVDGSRNAGVVYGFETFTITRALTVSYGARYARYDYLADRNLFSPQVTMSLAPFDRFRINALVSSLATAPGAEEFVPPADSSLWLPTQRTFSPLIGGSFESERTTHAQFEVERDFGSSTVLVRAFTQQVDEQLMTVFGATMPGSTVSSPGHYLAGPNGAVEASGWATGFRTTLADRVHATIDYTQTRAHWTPETDLSYLIIVQPSESSVIRSLSTTIETDVPETATKVLVLYRVSNGFARAPAAAAAEEPLLDSRFDVQVRQSLPFMDFSSARWEMLVAVKNFFREAAAGQSVYDELLVVNPPKRIVGGLTLHF